MQFEHDKEIEALLRRVAKGDAKAAAAGSHLDADQISMFSENAMPDSGRARAIGHLADCDRCRTILSGVIAMKAEDKPDEVVAPVAVESVIETPPEASWISRLFATRNLAFGFGTLALLFAGFLGFTVISSLQSGGTELAKADRSEIAPAESKQMTNANAAAISTGEDMNADDRLSNKEDNAAGAPAADETLLAPSPASNSGKDVAVEAQKPRLDGFTDSKRDRFREKDVAESVAEEDAVPADQERPALAAADKIAAPKPAPPPVVTGARRSVESELNDAAVMKKKEGAGKEKANEPLDAAASTELKQVGRTAKAPAARKVEGKTFTRRNDAWYDSAYKDQPATSVKRGTDSYRKLDAGLRSIGNTLSGTVFVVWKSKAYRIQ